MTHGAEEALVHWCTLRGLEARPLGMVGYGDEDESEVVCRRGRGMNRFAALLDRLAYEPSRNSKLRLLTEYFRTTPDPDRGYALAAITGALTFRHAKPGIIRALIAERTDPMLFELSYDYVGDLSETVALMWPSGNDAVPSPRGRCAPLPPRSGGEGLGVGGGSSHSDAAVLASAPPTPDPSRHALHAWVEGSPPPARRRHRFPTSSPRSPRSASPSCRRNSPPGSTRSTRPGAGRC